VPISSFRAELAGVKPDDQRIARSGPAKKTCRRVVSFRSRAGGV
jgi:hypothetical protein